jgi:hypothetical protein
MFVQGISKPCVWVIGAMNLALIVLGTLGGDVNPLSCLDTGFHLCLAWHERHLPLGSDTYGLDSAGTLPRNCPAVDLVT